MTRVLVEDKGESRGRRCTFWTLMLWLVLLKIRLARIAFAKRRAYHTVSWNDEATGKGY